MQMKVLVQKRVPRTRSKGGDLKTNTEKNRQAQCFLILLWDFFMTNDMTEY